MELLNHENSAYFPYKHTCEFTEIALIHLINTTKHAYYLYKHKREFTGIALILTS